MLVGRDSQHLLWLIAEFVSCPSCGRTLFDLQEVTESIRTRTGHLPGLFTVCCCFHLVLCCVVEAACGSCNTTNNDETYSLLLFTIAVLSSTARAAVHQLSVCHPLLSR